jgi:hypothetical protein
MAKRRRGPWLGLLASVEKAILNLMIGLVVTIVGQRLRKRLGGR